MRLAWRLSVKPPQRPVTEATSEALSRSRIRRRITTGLVLTLSATMVEQTGLPSALRAMTLSAWTATMNRLLDSIFCNSVHYIFTTGSFDKQRNVNREPSVSGHGEAQIRPD